MVVNSQDILQSYASSHAMFGGFNVWMLILFIGTSPEDILDGYFMCPMEFQEPKRRYVISGKT